MPNSSYQVSNCSTSNIWLCNLANFESCLNTCWNLMRLKSSLQCCCIHHCSDHPAHITNVTRRLRFFVNQRGVSSTNSQSELANLPNVICTCSVNVSGVNHTLSPEKVTTTHNNRHLYTTICYSCYFTSNTLQYLKEVWSVSLVALTLSQHTGCLPRYRCRLHHLPEGLRH